MDTNDVLTAIRNGKVDDDLNEVYNAIKARLDVIGKKQFAALKVGDTVRFRDQVGKGLGGSLGEVVDKKRTRISIKSEIDGQVYVGNASLVEVV